MFSDESQIKLNGFKFFPDFENNPWTFQVRRNFQDSRSSDHPVLTEILTDVAIFF